MASAIGRQAGLLSCVGVFGQFDERNHVILRSSTISGSARSSVSVRGRGNGLPWFSA